MSDPSVFQLWQPKYAACGFATFPVKFVARGDKLDKVPAVKHYMKLGLRASTELTRRFADAVGIGIALGHATANHDRVLLVFALPRGLRLDLLAFEQEVERLVLGEQRLALLAKARRDRPVARLSDRCIAQHLRVREPLDPPPRRIVHMPAREDHDQAGVLGEAREEIV